MKKIMTKTAFYFVSIVAAILACGEENLIKNGDFESIDDNKKFTAWRHGSNVTVEKIGRNHFAKLVNSQIGAYTSISQEFDLNPDWESLALSIKMKVISLDDKPELKSGDVPRAMFVFLGPNSKKEYRPLCHLADKTNNNWVLLYEIINIPADSKKCELVIDLPGVIAETCVDDIKVYPNPGKIYPLEILETAGKFDYLRTRKPVSPPGWIMDYNINKMDNPPIRIEREGNESFLRVENDNPTKTVVLDNYFSLDTNWKKINIKAKIRTKNLKCGNEGWQNARVMVTFVDKIGQKVGGYGECPEAKTDQNWTEKSVVREIPEGAAGVRLQVGLFNATGIADFDDISISKAE